MDIPSSRVGLIKSGELSNLASRREPGSLSHLWRASRGGNERSDSQSSIGSQLVAAVNAARQPRPMASSGLHPFAIYLMPSQFQNYKLDDPSTAWRAVFVRNGFDFTTTIDPEGDSQISGTDKVDQPYDDVFGVQSDGSLIPTVHPIIVPDDTPYYWFWIDTDAEEVCYGADPTAPDHGSAWTSFPTVDGTHFVIGWVDTQTVPTNRAIIRNIQETDLLSGGGGGGSSIQYVSFYQAMAQYTVCKTGAGAYIGVAKPKDIQYTASYTSGTIYNQNLTIAYPNDPSGSVAESSNPLAYVYRSVTISGSTEYQGICPPYLATSTQGSPTSVICAITATTGLVAASGDTLLSPGSAITLQEISARAWTAFSDQTFGH